MKNEKKKAKKVNEFLPRKVVDMRNQIENEGDRGSRRKWVKILPLAFPRQHVEGARTTPRQCGGGFVIVPEIKCPIFQVETKHKMPLPTIHKVKSHIQTDSRLFWHNSKMKILPLIWGSRVQSNFHQGLLGSSNVNTGKKLQPARRHEELGKGQQVVRACLF